MYSSTNLNLFKPQKKLKRNVILLSYSLGWGSPTPTIIGYYKNIVSQIDLCYRLITDLDILEKEQDLYRQLILINHDRLRGHERLGNLSQKIKSGQPVDLKLADIVRLYTERMDPWAIVSDISSIKGHKTYQLCYEDEAIWQQIVSVHFDQCQGWVEYPLSPSEGSPVSFPGSPSGSPSEGSPVSSSGSPSISPSEGSPVSSPGSPSISPAGSPPRSPSISPPRSPPRQINLWFDYDHEDKDGHPIPLPKRTPIEEKMLKIRLDLELDWLWKGRQDFDPATSEGKRKIAMGWKPIS